MLSSSWSSSSSSAQLVALVSTCVLLLLLLLMEGSAASTTHVVGGSIGWTIPANATVYPDWVSNQPSFAVGDTLVFNFQTGLHNVIQVAKSDYDACTAKKPIGSTISTGPAKLTITSTGDHYYICGVSGHCSFGQKLAIVAKASTGKGTGPPPIAAGSPMPVVVAVTPATAPTNSPAPSSGGSGSSGGSPTSSSSLPSAFRTASTFSIVLPLLLLSIA